MPNRCLRQLGVMFFAWLLSPAIVSAQSPWQVTVTPTLNPLPIGLCGAVHVIVRDATGTDTPRNGLGARLTIADFDMTVAASGAKSVAGQQIDASHWSVCACTGATVGSVATVTASYPAQSLPAAARVPGVAFTTTATFVIAPAKGTNPAACLAPRPAPAKPSAATPPPSSNTAGAAAAPKVVSTPAGPAPVPNISAPSTAPPASAKPGAPPSQAAAAAANSQPTTPAPQPPPQVPFPESPADWAALQASMGSSGWAELQEAVNESLQQTDADEKLPPGLAAVVGGRNHAMAVAAFKGMLPVLRHGRCSNCHMDITYVDQAAYSVYMKDGTTEIVPAEPATHKGGDINELPAKEEYRAGDIRLMPCADCHTKAPKSWEDNGPRWNDLDDYQLCQKLKETRFDGEFFLEHIREDALIKTAFEGRRGIDGVAPLPPPLTHAEFLRVTTEWIQRMDAMKKFPKARSEGCPRTDAWSGAIEYTYTEVGKLTKHESHGAVHIVGGLAKWSALAARTEDHSAKNCRDVINSSASGNGEIQLVTIDYTSERPVTGITMPKPGAVKKPGAAPARDTFVALTIFPGRYGLAIDLPMTGSGTNSGGGSACPGYKSHTRQFDGKIGESVDGKFDPDNPDEISGTKSYSPFPGASVTVKWQFMRQNEDRGR